MQRYTTFIKCYTFLEIDLSTLIEIRNNLQFPQAVCKKKKSFMSTALPQRHSCHFFFFYGDKDNRIPYPFFVCKRVGRLDIGKFTVNKANVKSILIKKFREFIVHMGLSS